MDQYFQGNETNPIKPRYQMVISSVPKDTGITTQILIGKHNAILKDSWLTNTHNVVEKPYTSVRAD